MPLSDCLPTSAFANFLFMITSPSKWTEYRNRLAADKNQAELTERYENQERVISLRREEAQRLFESAKNAKVKGNMNEARQLLRKRALLNASIEKMEKANTSIDTIRQTVETVMAAKDTQKAMASSMKLMRTAVGSGDITELENTMDELAGHVEAANEFNDVLGQGIDGGMAVTDDELLAELDDELQRESSNEIYQRMHEQTQAASGWQPVNPKGATASTATTSRGMSEIVNLPEPANTTVASTNTVQFNDGDASAGAQQTNALVHPTAAAQMELAAGGTTSARAAIDGTGW